MGGGLLGTLKKKLFSFSKLDKVTSFSVTLLFSSVLHFFLLKKYKIVNCFGKIYWVMNSGPQWAGD